MGVKVSEKSLTWNMKLLGADRSGQMCNQNFDQIQSALCKVSQALVCHYRF